jgi:hypothetical protein
MTSQDACFAPGAVLTGSAGRTAGISEGVLEVGFERGGLTRLTDGCDDGTERGDPDRSGAVEITEVDDLSDEMGGDVTLGAVNELGARRRPTRRVAARDVELSLPLP